MSDELVTMTHPDLPADQTIQVHDQPRSIEHYTERGWKLAPASKQVDDGDDSGAATSRRKTTTR